MEEKMALVSAVAGRINHLLGKRSVIVAAVDREGFNWVMP